MSKTTSFSLDEHFTGFVISQVEHGRYGSASDVVRAGVRLLAEQEVHLDILRKALLEGKNSGVSAPFDFDAFITDKRNRDAPEP